MQPAFLSSHAWTQIVVALVALALTACGGSGGDGAPVTMTLTATPTTHSEIELSWTLHTPDTVRYSVVRNGVVIFTHHRSYTSYSSRNLLPSTKYCYVIKAVDVFIGLRGQSNAVCTTTKSVAGWPTEVVDHGANISLALDNANFAHASFSNSDGVYYTTNASGQWFNTAVDTSAGQSGHTSIDVTLSGIAHISYHDSTNDDLHYGSNATGTWITNIISRGGLANSLTLDPLGNAHISYALQTRGLYYATNKTGIWQSVRAGYRTGAIRQSEIRLDSAGNVHIAYARGDEIRYTNNIGNTWNRNKIAFNRNLSRSGVSLDLDSNDIPHIAYMDFQKLMHAANASGTWVSSVVDTMYWAAGGDVSLDVDDFDSIHISYQDNDFDLRYATGSPGSWKILYLDAVGKVGSDSAIKVDPNSVVKILYTDDTNGSIKLATSP